MKRTDMTFRQVWIGSTISLLGDIGFMLALPWLVLQMTGSSLALGSVMMALAIPRALMMLLGGAFSDRYPARIVLAVAYIAQALCVTLIAVLLHVQMLNLQVLYLVALCFGTADAFTSPALRVLLPELVADEQLQRANALLQGTSQLCLLGGSAIGGLLIAHWGLLYVFMADAASYLGIIALLLCMGTRRRASAAGEPASLRRAIADGLRYVWRDDGLRPLLIGFGYINFCSAGATQVGLVMLASDRYGSSGLGMLMAGAAAGSLAGLAAAGKWQPSVSVQRSVVLAALALSALLSTLALPMPLWCACLDAALLGAVAGYINIGVLSALQRSVRSDMLGRVMSVLGLASAGIAPLSMAVTGMAARLGTAAPFLGAAALLLLTVFIVRRPPAAADAGRGYEAR